MTRCASRSKLRRKLNLALKVPEHVKASKQKSCSPLVFLSNVNMLQRGREPREVAQNKPYAGDLLQLKVLTSLEEDVVFSIHNDFSHIFARCADSRDFIVNQVTFDIWQVLPFPAIMSRSNKFCK